MRSRIKELILLHFLNDGVRTTLIVLLPFIAKDLSLSISQAGLIGASQPLLTSILALPAGYITGKIGGFRLIFALLLIYSISSLGIAFSLNIYMLLAMYALAAIGFGMFHTVGFVLTGRNSIQSDVGRNMANFTSIGEIGRFAIPPLAVFVTPIIGWRFTIAVIGGICLLVFAASQFYLSLKDDAPTNSENSTQNYKEYFRDTIKLLKNKRALHVMITAALDSFASSPIYVYLPFLLVAKKISPAELGIAMGFFFIGSLIGKSVLGRRVDKLGNKRVFVASEICMALSLIFIALSSNYVLLLLFSTLLGTFTKGTSPVVYTMFSELADKEHYHKIFAISELILGLSAVIAIIILGRVADVAGITVTFYICAALALVATIPILTLGKIKSASK